MPDYRIMYLELMQATERAIQTLEETQLRCKELYSEGIDEEKDQNEGRQKKITGSNPVAFFCNGENL